MKKLTVLIMLAFAGYSLAGTGTGKITGVFPFTKGTGEKMFFIKVEQNQSPVACNTTDRFVMSDSEPSFPTTYSAVLAAYHAKTTVKVAGKDSCNNWSNSEDILYVCFGDIAC